MAKCIKPQKLFGFPPKFIMNKNLFLKKHKGNNSQMKGFTEVISRLFYWYLYLFL